MPAAADMPGADAPEEDGLADDALPPFVRDASGPGRRSARPLVLEELKQIERDLHAAGDHALSGDDERTGRLPEPGASEALTSLDQAAHGGEEEEIDVDAVLESLRSSSEVSAPDDLIEGARAAHSPLAWHEDEETADRATPRAPQRESFSTEKLSRPKAGGSTTERLGALSARLKAMRERRRSDQQSEIECDDES